MATELDYMEYTTDALAMAAYPTNDTLYGGSIVSRTSALGGGYTVLIKSGSGATIANAGTVRRVSYYTSSGSVSIKFKVFRVSGSDYNYVGESEAFTTTAGGATRALTTPITGVLSGDLIGIYLANNLNNVWGTDAGYVISTINADVTSNTAQATWTDAGPGLMGIAVRVDTIDVSSESAIKTQGSYSLKSLASTSSSNKTLTRTVSPVIDLTGVDTLRFDIYSSRTGSNIKIGIHDSGGTTTETTPNITSANTWQTVVWDISAVSTANKDAIDSIIITIVNADSANTFYIDNFISAENVSVTAEPFIITTSLSSLGGIIVDGLGYVYEESISGAGMDVSLRTGSAVMKNILQRKNLKYIYHRINTHGKDATMTVYIDGVAQTPTFTINTSTLTTRRIEDIPDTWEGKRFDIELSCDDVTDDDLEIHAPLVMRFTSVGN